MLITVLHRLVTAASDPGPKMIPAAKALLSLLTRKLIDKERLSHIHEFNCEKALGLFGGLKITSSQYVEKLVQAC